ncbi:OmpA family protein [Gilvimarinus chinensis]|uniref:OmpA family protein n=1 Tax=Gilvimarinus chinensis TaxID=396005 RepID=UPI00036089C3|nr:OmpA family protein [Gilvimarinus chinensis]
MKSFLVGLTTLSISLFSSLAEAEEADHPLVSRYGDAEIYQQREAHYTESYVALSQLKDDETIDKLAVIGKQTLHVYTLGGSRSPLEVAENYKQAVDKLGGKVLLYCHTEDPCGLDFSRRLLKPVWISSAASSFSDFSQSSDGYQFISAKVGPEASPTYLQWIIKEEYSDTLEIAQIITEPESLLLGQVTVDTNAIRQSNESSPTSISKKEDDSGQDHPLISRYQGSAITHYFQTEFAEVRLATGVVDENDKVPHLNLKGKSTLIGYAASKDQSTLQVFENYLDALKKSGFEILFQCEHRSCGDEQIQHLWSGSSQSGRFGNAITTSTYANDDYRMLTAKKEIGNKEVYLSVYIYKGGAIDEVEIVHDIVEPTQMTTDRVSINTEYLEDSLAREGKVVLHGLNFDTGKAELLSSSQQALDVIVAYLESAPEQQFYVVGHTDTRGDHALNMQLSKDRAESIRGALVEQGVTADRLMAAGVGAMAPVSTNGSDDGRAKNRRVELVLH